jgi:hypothetical protein
MMMSMGVMMLLMMLMMALMMMLTLMMMLFTMIIVMMMLKNIFNVCNFRPFIYIYFDRRKSSKPFDE